jgi:AcrR family transcriptional regulator
VDEVRVLRLLWRGEEHPSARTGLTVGRIVRAGVDVADGAGLEALSMRRVAERLGVGAMSLYTYVPGRQELLLLMVDEVYGELSDPATGRPDGARDDSGTHGPGAGAQEAGTGAAGTGGAAAWREGLVRMADDHWRLYERHPWLLDVPVSRPLLGPHVMGTYERELRLVDGLGLDELEMNATIELIQEHVAGAARRLRAIRQDAAQSGITDDEWWYRIVPTLTQVLAGHDFPLSARVGEAIGAPHLDTSYLMRFGLERILDGLETRIGRAREGAPASPPPPPPPADCS